MSPHRGSGPADRRSPRWRSRAAAAGPGRGSRRPGQHRVIALRQLPDEAVRVGELGGGDAFLVRRVQPPEADIVHDRAGEQVRVLQHHAERAPQVRLLDLVDVDAVVADLAVLDIVEAVDQVRDRRLAGAGGADEGDLLAGLRVQLDVVQHHLLRHIAEIDAVQYAILQRQ